MTLDLLKSTSNKDVSFMSDVNHIIDIDKKGRFKYFYNYNFDIKLIKEFIWKLEPNNFYTLIPLISKSAKDTEAHVILSKQILVTNYSNYITINNFLIEQLERFQEDFNFTELNNYYLIFKYKKVYLNLNI